MIIEIEAYEGDKLHVFVDASDNTECWRVFAMTDQSPHLLVTGLGYSVNEWGTEMIEFFTHM